MKRRPRLENTLRVIAAIAASGFAVLAYVYVTLPDVRPLATSNPTTTAFMALRASEAEEEGRKLRHVHRWVAYTRISLNLRRAVLVTEDSAFFEHDGIDIEQIKQSIQANIEKGTVRGASTITQQLAKNLYLSPSRDPLRKLRELIIARRLEAELSKARILEIYLNVIEWGDGIWGAEAAARTYFGVSAASLSREQAALLAAAISSPRTSNPARPSPRLVRRQRTVLARMGSVEPPPPAPVVVPQTESNASGELHEIAPAEPPVDSPPPAEDEDVDVAPDATPGAPESAPVPLPFPAPAQP